MTKHAETAHKERWPGETWLDTSHRWDRYVLRRKSDGALWIYGAGPGISDGFHSWSPKHIRSGDGCCLGCRMFLMSHHKLGDTAEIVERRWNPDARDGRGDWEEVGVVGRDGRLIEPCETERGRLLAALTEEQHAAER